MNEYLDMNKIVKLQELKPLARANMLALMVFKERVDLAGNIYIRHLNKVADSFSEDDYKIVALLHDLVEDTSFTFEDLEYLGFSKIIIDALKLLTNDLDNYDSYIERLVSSDNEMAKKVKIVDLLDNMNITRFKKLETKDIARVKNKYLKAYSILINDIERRIENDRY